jgi:DNA-binding HxlR family transcriptional regulator
MTQLDTSNKACVPTLKLLGDFWSLRIIDALSDGEMHFCALQRVAGNVNPVTLTTKLKKLEESVIIERNEESRTDVTYRLTKLGLEILPVLAAINTFAETARKTDKSPA